MRYLSLMLCATVCLGADKYVATTGSDATGTGAIDAPWRTIRHGIDTMAAGDTLYLRGGTYEENVIPNSAIKSGTGESTPTRFIGYTGESAIFRPTNNVSSGHGFYAIAKSNLWWEGFTVCMTNCPGFTNSPISAMGLQGVYNVTVTNMALVNVPRNSSIFVFESSGRRHNNVKIVGNTFANWGYNLWFRTNSLGEVSERDYMPWAIYMRNGDDALVSNNIAIGPAEGYTDNDPDYVMNRKLGGYQIQKGSNLVVQANIVQVPGMAWDAEQNTNCVWENNLGVVTWTNYGALFVDWQNTRMANCTLYGPTGAGPTSGDKRGINWGGTTGGSWFANNIVWNFTTAFNVSGTGTVSLTNNVFGGGLAAFNILDSRTARYNTIDSDPFFTDTDDFPDGFKWPLNSPARNAGVDLSSLFAVDYYGTERPQETLFDIGFYEWSEGGQLPTVSVAADGTGYAHELGLVPQTFTFTRTESSSGNLTVNYTITGTATAALHYTAFSESVVIANGNWTATATVTPLAVAGYQGDKTVIVTLDEDEDYTLKSPSAATITIAEADPPPQRILRTQPAPGQTSQRGPKR